MSVVGMQSALALYGASRDTASVSLVVNAITEWFRTLAPAQILACTSNSEAHKPILTRHASVEEAMQQVENCDNVELYLMRDVNEDVRKCLAAAEYRWTRRWGQYVCVTGLTDFLSLEDLAGSSRLHAIIAASHPAYGIALTISRSWGLFDYLKGSSVAQPGKHSQADFDEGWRIDSWGTAVWRGRYRLGLLRDVYPFNYLSAQNLSQDVGGIPLRAWIEEDRSRGTLSPLPAGLTLWTVPEAQQDAIRTVLTEARIIYDCQHHEAVLPPPEQT